MTAARPPLSFGPREVTVERRPDGAVVLRSPVPLPPYPRQLGEVLRAHARDHAAATFLAERGPDGAWRRLSYGAAAARADRVSQALLARGHGADRPVAALSDNSIEVALLMLGAMQVGIPFLPVSPAYSLLSDSHEKLRHAMALVRPGLVYVADLARYGRALAALDLDGVAVVSGTPGDDGALTFADLLEAEPGPEVEAAFATVDGDSVAKILLTSGSTGLPKGVINTQRMLCSVGAGTDVAWPFLAERPPVMVDWLPWNHTFGANHTFNTVLRHHGTLYIDEGRPAPGRFEATVRNLRDVQPTLVQSVPRYYDMLLPHLEGDEAFCAHFFGELDLILYAGAAMPRSLMDRLWACSRRVRGDAVPIVTSLGSTETAPSATAVTWPDSVPGSLGLPLPGVEIKLAPVQDRHEFRVRGPIVTPGYFRQPDLTAQAFDDEGFFCMGDAVRFVDPARPEEGLLFDGRIAENFKLTTGTWVNVGTLRLDVISAASPAVQDAVIAGEGRDEIAVLLIPNLDGCARVTGTATHDPASLAGDPALRRFLAEALSALNRGQRASSRRVGRALLLTQPLSVDANEITDKGYINQRATLARRQALVERLYAAGPDDAQVIVVGDGTGPTA